MRKALVLVAVLAACAVAIPTGSTSPFTAAFPTGRTSPDSCEPIAHEPDVNTTGLARFDGHTVNCYTVANGLTFDDCYSFTMSINDIYVYPPLVLTSYHSHICGNRYCNLCLSANCLRPDGTERTVADKLTIQLDEYPYPYKVSWSGGVKCHRIGGTEPPAP